MAQGRLVRIQLTIPYVCRSSRTYARRRDYSHIRTGVNKGYGRQRCAVPVLTESQLTYVQTPVPALIRLIFVLSPQQMLWVVVPILVCTIVSSSLHRSAYCFKQLLVSLKSPENHSQLGAVIRLSHRSARNSLMSLHILTTKNLDDQGIVQAS